MNTPATSPSGNVHDMPLAALLGQVPAELSEIGNTTPAVRPTRVALVGIRSLDAREKLLVRQSRVHVFTMSDIDRVGLATVTQRARSFSEGGLTCMSPSIWTRATLRSRRAG